MAARSRARRRVNWDLAFHVPSPPPRSAMGGAIGAQSGWDEEKDVSSLDNPDEGGQRKSCSSLELAWIVGAL